MIDVYESAVDASGRYAAAFERDDETAYFYLLDLARDEGKQIVEAFSTYTVTTMPADAPVLLQWDSGGDAVGLFIAGDLIAVFELGSYGKKGRWATDDDKSLFVRH
ncbi:MAG: DUF2251 domain-containing protein [Mesorhizobium sp.]|nr:MAG: DUF2251 domain-containing protein [Mesorhizobium sp.]